MKVTPIHSLFTHTHLGRSRRSDTGPVLQELPIRWRRLTLKQNQDRQRSKQTVQAKGEPRWRGPWGEWVCVPREGFQKKRPHNWALEGEGVFGHWLCAQENTPSWAGLSTVPQRKNCREKGEGARQILSRSLQVAPLSHGAASARGDCPDLRTSERTRGPT